MSRRTTTRSSRPLDKNPIKQFSLWFDEAKARPEIQLPEAMCLSTVSPSGDPEGRMLLLKGYDEGGFVFYTNFDSPKAKALAKSPKAALTVYWEDLHRQIRISGKVQRVSDAEADAYFASRPRLSQIAAWVSRQSEPIESREALEKEFAAVEKKYEGKEVPRPSFWGGYRLIPDRIEFWKERPNRLHDRFLYTRRGDRWDMKLLYP